MISDSHKFLFIDIVKTGGTAIGSVLELYGGKGKHHAIGRPLPELSRNEGLVAVPTEKTLQEYFCFTIVRNPFDRLISLYSFCQTAPMQKRFAEGGWKAILKRGLNKIPAKEINRKTYWPEDFIDFVEWMLDHENYFSDYTGEKYIAMHEWLRDSEGKMRIDYVGRFESLQEEAKIIMEKLQLPPQSIPIRNESFGEYKKRAGQCIYKNNDVQKAIESRFKEDFDLFGYATSFESSISYKSLQAQ